MRSELNTSKIKINNKKQLKDFLSYESKKYGKKNTRMPLVCITEK